MPGNPSDRGGEGHWNADGSWTPAGPGNGPAGTPAGPGGTNPGANNVPTPPGGNPVHYGSPDSYQQPGFGGLPPAEIGGTYGGAASLANSLAKQGEGFQGRQGTDLFNEGNTADVNVDAARANAEGYHQQQQAALGGLHNLATGGGPSAATMGMASGIDANLGGQFAAAHSGGAPGLAGYGATGAGTAPNLSAIAAGGAGRGNEVYNAQRAYAQGTGAVVGGDLHQQGLDNQFATEQAQLKQQQAAQNDKMQLAYEGMGEQTIENQLNADTREYGVQLGDQSNLGVVNYNNSNALTQNLVGAAASGAGAGGVAIMNAATAPGEPTPDPYMGNYSDSPDVVNSDMRLKYDFQGGAPSLAEIACR